MTVLKQKMGMMRNLSAIRIPIMAHYHFNQMWKENIFIHFFHQEDMTSRQKKKDNFILSKFLNSS